MTSIYGNRIPADAFKDKFTNKVSKIMIVFLVLVIEAIVILQLSFF